MQKGLESKVRWLIPWLTIVAILSSPIYAAANEVEKHSVSTIDLTASGTYINPFTEVSLIAYFMSPDSQRQLVIHGFYNGDGQGEQDGNVWSIKFTGDEIGTWTYTTTSNDPGLDGQTGAIEVIPSTQHGAIIADPEHQHWLKYEDGPNVHLHGNFLDPAAGPAPIGWSHLFLSESVSNIEKQAMIDRAHAIGANKINIYLANKADYSSSYPTTPWLGTSQNNDKTRFDLARWHTYEQEIARLAEEGFTPELWFFADDSAFGSISDENIERFLQYGMARLSAYPVIFVLMLEWEEGFTIDEVRRYGQYIQDHNPYGRLVSVHGTTGNFDFPNDAWTTFMPTQPGNTVNYANNYAFSRTHWSLPQQSKPHFNEEFGINYDDGDENMRRKLWMAFVGGSAATGTGNSIRAFDTFFSLIQPDYWNMEPDDTIIEAAGTDAHCLSHAGTSYICYEPVGGTITLRASEIMDDFTYTWYDPRAGTITETGIVRPINLTLIPPGPGDWALHLNRTTTSSSCLLTADPSEGTGPFMSILTATFQNLPGSVEQTDMSCMPGDTLSTQIIDGEASRSCLYPVVEEETVYQATAQADTAECSTEVIDLVECHPGDTDCDGSISSQELQEQIVRWLEGQTTLALFIECIQLWKTVS
ncbi:MAG: DUF5060 domain-containing protein [Nanoarchaeota archaeon]